MAGVCFGEAGAFEGRNDAALMGAGRCR